jgi:UDP-GlcNAc:undecaprenyl-phosphate GlcNAc-1-phosphate transferase
VPLLILALIPAALAISLPLTALVIRAGHRLGAFDSPGVPGQVKLERRRVPNTGGIAIFWGIALPMLLGLAFIWLAPGPSAALPGALEGLREHILGIRAQTPLALLLLASLLLLHIMGLIDDRRPLGPGLKLAVMLAPAAAIPILSDTRLLTMLDGPAGGTWASIAVTVFWFVVVTNAMNFLDNMDGLSAGVATVASACFLGATLVSPRPQWFIAAVLALLIGACLGFLVFNFPVARASGGRTAGGTPAPPTPAPSTPAPPTARVYMGDGGSLVLGFLLAFLTTRTTYAELPAEGLARLSASSADHWHALFMPLVVLAVPLYDFVSVVVIRLSQGRSPFLGDTQHLSHRLTRLGLSRRAAVLVIYALTGATGISGIVLGSLRPWQAVMVAVQVALILLALALFEYARVRGSRREHAAAAAPCPDAAAEQAR